MQILNAIYDLKIAPCSYDFFAFLLSAEAHRKRNGFDKINLIFTPGDKKGFRNDNLRSHEQNTQFFLNVILPGGHFLKSVVGINWINNRNEFLKLNILENNIFPRGYSINNPKTDYVMRGLVTSYFREEEPVLFHTPEYSINIARKILENISKEKKIITLTVRELERDDFGKTRTINYPAWEKVFKKLEKSQYQPVIIRDTSKAHLTKPLFKNVPEITTASYHLHIRYALYEKSYLNFFKNNGTWLPAFYSKSKIIAFNQFDNKQLVLSETWFKNNYGMSKGCQFPLTPKNSLIEWEGESTEIILAHIFETAKNLSNNESVGWPYYCMNNIVNSAQIAINQTLLNLKSNIMLEDLIVFKNLKVHMEKGNISFDNISKTLLSLEGKVIPKNTLQKLLQLDNKHQLKVFA